MPPCPSRHPSWASSVAPTITITARGTAHHGATAAHVARWRCLQERSGRVGGGERQSPDRIALELISRQAAELRRSRLSLCVGMPAVQQRRSVSCDSMDRPTTFATSWWRKTAKKIVYLPAHDWLIKETHGAPHSRNKRALPCCEGASKCGFTGNSLCGSSPSWVPSSRDDHLLRIIILGWSRGR